MRLLAGRPSYKILQDDDDDDDDDSGKDEASAEELAAPHTADIAANVNAAAEGEGAEEGGLGGTGTATAPTATSIIEQCIVDWESKVQASGRGGSGSLNVCFGVVGTPHKVGEISGGSASGQAGVICVTKEAAPTKQSETLHTQACGPDIQSATAWCGTCRISC